MVRVRSSLSLSRTLFHWMCVFFNVGKFCQRTDFLAQVLVVLDCITTLTELEIKCLNVLVKEYVLSTIAIVCTRYTHTHIHTPIHKIVSTYVYYESAYEIIGSFAGALCFMFSAFTSPEQWCTQLCVRWWCYNLAPIKFICHKIFCAFSMNHAECEWLRNNIYEKILRVCNLLVNWMRFQLNICSNDFKSKLEFPN